MKIVWQKYIGGLFVSAAFILAAMCWPSQSLALSWKQVNSNGFGDPNNVTIVGFVEFGGRFMLRLAM